MIQQMEITNEELELFRELKFAIKARYDLNIVMIPSTINHYWRIAVLDDTATVYEDMSDSIAFANFRSFLLSDVPGAVSKYCEKYKNSLQDA